jgi:four helix bundle protein
MLENFIAFQIAKLYYWKCKSSKIPRFLQEQLLRASSSIGLNLARRVRKADTADQRRFYAIAYGSLRECQAIMELEQVNDPEIRDLSNQLGAMLFTLCRKSLPVNRTDPVSDADAAAES